MTERWKPKHGEDYWYVDFNIEPCEDKWEDWRFDDLRYEASNCFRTEEEAAAAAEKVKALLLSLHQPEDGNSQKTPISESLQQEDCKKRAFVRPSHETPEHYRLDPEPISVIKGWDLGFCLGNVIKCIARAGEKEGESRDSDLHKAMEYLRMELEDEGK
ncbi:DUF3310 domain-containing protein [Faecalibaculum rodentium]|uniref:DUF3310 domain-containing protein n=1 Tax=Faecalibaculum rodentium TaxID=1702221 RepID=UPI00272A726B|nr:DUF3310 domain-containing protein [Faecalibaculum rodentium]